MGKNQADRDLLAEGWLAPSTVTIAMGIDGTLINCEMMNDRKRNFLRGKNALPQG